MKRKKKKTPFPRRRWTVLAVFAVTAVVLLWRVVDLNLTRGEFLQTEGNSRYLRVIKRVAHRGMILDRNGASLALSTPVESVWANPRELAGDRTRWKALTRALGLNGDQLQRTLSGRMDREFVYLKRHVPPRLGERVQALGVSGVYLQREYRRYYPAAEVAAHVTGFTNVDDIGQEGMELAYESSLRGVDGSSRVIRDRLGRVVEYVEQISAARPGKDLVLSLDRRIQYLAYRALKAGVKRNRARSGSVVVLDVRTGEVLAMVNQPSYNPNDRAQRVGSRSRNRAVTDIFEPGSTIKPFTVASALEAGRVRPATILDTSPGHMKVGRHTVRDLRNYGPIDVRTIIQKSSNVGASRLALDLAPRRFWKTLSRSGFGQVTGSGFPGEAPGILTHHADWGEIHRATLSYGYGLSVTPLQLAQAYTVIASDGRLVPPSFERLEAPPKGERVLSPRIARQVREMLETVTLEGGTGQRAAVPGYRVAGKTGTVRKPAAGGYAEDRYLAVFAGMAPASAPRLVVVVTVDEPGGEEYYGGQVAAPVFASVMEGALRMLGVAPDEPALLARRVPVAEPALALRRVSELALP